MFIVKLARSEQLPQMICLDCNMLLETFFATKRKFIENQKILSSLLQQLDEISVKVEIDSESCFIIEGDVQVKLEPDVEEFNMELSNEAELSGWEPNNVIEPERKTVKEPKVKRRFKTKATKDLKKTVPKRKRILFPCDQCDKRPQTDYNLAKHKWKCHNMPKPGPYFICELCSKQFSTPDAISRHIDMHENRTRFECGKTKNFIRKYIYLKVRISKHFSDICGFKSHAKTDFRAHVLTHLPAESRIQFSCAECSATFFTNRNLKNHIRSFHVAEKPFPCQLCSKGFITEYRRNQHFRIVHQKHRPFACIAVGCISSFPGMYALKRHVRRMHKDLVDQLK